MIEEGMYLKVGEQEFYIGAIKEYKGKKYAYFIDEQAEVGFFVELIEDENGCTFNRVQDETLSKLLIIEFSDIKNVIKEELENGN